MVQDEANEDEPK